MEQDIRYCTTKDGVRIAYCITGEGPPLLVCPSVIESFALDHMMPPYEQFMYRLGRNARLIRFDMRGTGLSDHNATDFSLEALIRDIDAVVTATGIESMDVLAPIFSVMRAIGYAIQRPERVRNLVLYEAHASGADVLRGDSTRGLAALARANWWAAAHAVAGSLRQPRQYAEGVYMVGEWNRKSASGEAFASLVEAMAETSVAGLLHAVATPTLILHHERDRLVKIDVAQKVAARIADSRMRVLDGAEPFFATEDAARDTAEAVESFLHAGNARTTAASPETPSFKLRSGDRAGLTAREVEVLRLIVTGKSGREIAAELALSPRTVERHVANIYRKTDTHGRAQLAGFALRRNIV